jgi:ariadne-1
MKLRTKRGVQAAAGQARTTTAKRERKQAPSREEESSRGRMNCEEESDDDDFLFSDFDSEEEESLNYMGNSDNEYADGTDSGHKLQFAVLDEDNIRRKADSLVQSVSSLLSVPESHSKALLRFYKWDENRLNDDWFSNEHGVREKVGLQLVEPSTSQAPSAADNTLVCGICFEKYPLDQMFALKCGHYFSKSCWQSYAENAIGDGQSCLQLRCIHPNCKQLVTEDVLMSLVDEAHQKKCESFSLSSFVDGNRKIKWCPAPGCSKAIESYESLSRNGPLDVDCSCGHCFCFTCGEENHRPADCEMRKKWVIKNSAESENLNWILANSKPCPKCKRPIEKNYGCMHMTCAVCKYEFCWLCLGAWADHGERTGGFYSCNKFEDSKKGGQKNDEKRRDFARASLERYMHYFERWAANKTSCKKARETLEKFSGTNDSLVTLSQNTSTPLSQLAFITEACNQVIECRRTLMWTYTYGYYNFDSSRAGNMKEFFEFLQGDAEWSLEKLHNCIEIELMKFTEEKEEEEEVPRETFDVFRSKLTGLTKVTKDYFDKLVFELENGLEEIKTKYGSL